MRLVAPDLRYARSFLAATEEFPAADDALTFERQLATKDLADYVRLTAAWAQGRELPEGWVANSTFWLVEADEYIGTANIRHKLNDWLRRYGGHIGYAIRPSRRREGHGTEICRLALDESKKIGLRRVLITCDDDNVGSRLIIERNGGVLESVTPQPDRAVPKRRYWVTLD